MKVNNLAVVGLALLAFAAGISTRAGAQAYDKKYAQSLILAGGGTSTANKLTISAATPTSSITLTLPASNAAGALVNNGSGGLSWSGLPVGDIPTGSANQFLITNNSSAIAWASLGVDGVTLTGNGVSTALAMILTHTNVWTAAQGSSQSIGATSTDGIVLSNTTPAASGTQEYSPRLHWNGRGWGGSSEAIDWIAQVVPVNSSSSPTSSYLDIEDQQNGTGGYSSDFDLFSSSGATLGIASPTDPGSGVLSFGTGIKVNGAAANGTLLIGNGTDFVPSTATYPASAGASGNILRSDGTNFISGAPNATNFTFTAGPYVTTNSKDNVMLGFGGTATFKPSLSGTVLIIATGNLWNSSGNPPDISTAQICFGTGAAPTYQTTGPVGTTTGSLVSEQSYSADNYFFFSATSVVTGLSSTNTYWIDLDLTAEATSFTSSINNVTITVIEF